MDYKRPKWAVNGMWRTSGLLEDICKHGIGHPNKDFLEKNPQLKKYRFDVHGCDGCCEGKKL
ncbi:MAG: hypothetical protein V1911_02405 [Candidatus Micrarchaeota archaeon]